MSEVIKGTCTSVCAFLHWSIVFLLYSVVSVSAVQQSESAIHILYPLFFGFPSHLGHPRALNRVPCAVQEVLSSYLFYKRWCVHVNPNLPTSVHLQTV